jgi:hypothetical protein
MQPTLFLIPAPRVSSAALVVNWVAEVRAGTDGRTSASGFWRHPLAAAPRRGEAQEAAEGAAAEGAAAEGAGVGMVRAARGARRREGLKGATGGETPAES